jgi:hypothetical protein
VDLQVVPDCDGARVRGRAAGFCREPVRENLDDNPGRWSVQDVVERRSGGTGGGDVATFQEVKALALAVRRATVSHGWLLVLVDPTIKHTASGDRSAGCFPSRFVLVPGGARHRSRTSFIPSEGAGLFQRFDG